MIVVLKQFDAPFVKLLVTGDGEKFPIILSIHIKILPLPSKF